MDEEKLRLRLLHPNGVSGKKTVCSCGGCLSLFPIKINIEFPRFNAMFQSSVEDVQGTV